MKNGTDEEKKAKEEYYTALEKFNEELSYKFDIVDPLDRKFKPADDAEQGDN